jgi:hypothetical protein
MIIMSTLSKIVEVVIVVATTVKAVIDVLSE